MLDAVERLEESPTPLNLRARNRAIALIGDMVSTGLGWER